MSQLDKHSSPSLIWRLLRFTYKCIRTEQVMCAVQSEKQRVLFIYLPLQTFRTKYADKRTCFCYSEEINIDCK